MVHAVRLRDLDVTLRMFEPRAPNRNSLLLMDYNVLAKALPPGYDTVQEAEDDIGQHMTDATLLNPKDEEHAQPEQEAAHHSDIYGNMSREDLVALAKQQEHRLKQMEERIDFLERQLQARISDSPSQSREKIDAVPIAELSDSPIMRASLCLGWFNELIFQSTRKFPLLLHPSPVCPPLQLLSLLHQLPRRTGRRSTWISLPRLPCRFRRFVLLGHKSSIAHAVAC